LIEPVPDLATQLQVVASGWVPGSGKTICDSKGLSLFLIHFGSGAPQVHIGDPHPLTDMGEVANPDPWGRPTWLGAVHLSVPSVRVRRSAAIEPHGFLDVNWYRSGSAGASGLVPAST
jgi:hypothetical protein